MTGIIKTYLNDKNYGFIKGDDQKDYFFHKSCINKHDLEKICDGALVSFEQKATPKGYNAIKILINSTSDIKYSTPEKIYTSKNNSVKGWEVLDISNWIVHGSSRNSPDEAKNDMLHGINLVRANTALNMQYYKTTGSEPGTGKGTYYYTIHNFRGRPANIGKKSLAGQFSHNDLVGINNHAKKLKTELITKTNEAKNKRLVFWMILLSIIGLSWIIQKDIAIFVSTGLIVLGFFLSHATDYDSWLEELK